jgi:hypothetical protein
VIVKFLMRHYTSRNMLCKKNKKPDGSQPYARWDDNRFRFLSPPSCFHQMTNFARYEILATVFFASGFSFLASLLNQGRL